MKASWRTGGEACGRCGHPADWHRLDDSLNLDVTDPATPFRCIGYDCEVDFSKPGDCDCPDYVIGRHPINERRAA